MKATIAAEPNYGMVTSHVLWASLLADAWLAAEPLDEVGPALEAADEMVRNNAQRYAEPLNLLVRAQYLHARGEPQGSVRAAFDAAAQRAVAVRRVPPRRRCDGGRRAARGERRGPLG